MNNKIKDFVTTYLFDSKFRKDYKHYILQSLIIFVCVSIVLMMWRILDDIVVASLGASSFILFVTPHTNGSRPRYIIGGYICGILSGLSFNLLYNLTMNYNFNGREFILAIICAAAVAVTAFIMVVTNSEHPPSAALALGLTIDTKSCITAFAAITSIIMLCILRESIKKHLKNLI